MKIKIFKSHKEVMEPFLNIKNFKSLKQAMEFFYGIKNFKTVMASFFRIEKIKSRDKQRFPFFSTLRTVRQWWSSL